MSIEGFYKSKEWLEISVQELEKAMEVNVHKLSRGELEIKYVRNLIELERLQKIQKYFQTQCDVAGIKINLEELLKEERKDE